MTLKLINLEENICLTGIKPTGEAHLGNYVGAILPAIKLQNQYHCCFFIADYHALNNEKVRYNLNEKVIKIAATWLACGLDPQKTFFYRQSDISQIFELSTILSCFATKSRLNGSHAYKAMVDYNEKNKNDPDSGINMGLFTYPILMAADILMFHANLVPVGKDQIQHIEIASDIAESLNRFYKKPILTIPKVLTHTHNVLIQGIDGRKMSKSYNNVIPLFSSGKKLRKTIMKIVTNSQKVEEKKNPEECSIYHLYKIFATPQEANSLAQRYRKGGMGWGEAKESLYQLLEERLSPIREKYNHWMQDTSKIEKLLYDGAQKARKKAKLHLANLKKAMAIL